MNAKDFSYHVLFVVGCAVLLFSLCLALPGIQAFGDEDTPTEPVMPRFPKAPAPAEDPSKNRARDTSELAKEYGLSSQEALILQPVLNELAMYRRASQAHNWQKMMYEFCLESKEYSLRKAIRHAYNAGSENVSRFNARRIVVVNGWGQSTDWDPSRSDEALWRPPSPPYGYLQPSHLPLLKNKVWESNRQRESRFHRGEYPLSFRWPASNRGPSTKKHLESMAAEINKQVSDLRHGPTEKTYRINFPFLGSVTKGQLKGCIKKITEQIPVLRAQIRAGELFMQSDARPGQILLMGPLCRGLPDYLVGWVTKQQVLDKIEELKKKQQAIYKEFAAKKLRITRDLIGSTSEDELDESIKQIHRQVKEMSDEIKKGDYKGWFPGPDKQYTLNFAKEEIRKINAHIKKVHEDKDYRAVVNRTRGASSLMSRAAIEDVLKRPYLTKGERAALIRGRDYIGIAKKLEIEYWTCERHYWDYVCSQLVFHYTKRRSVEGWYCSHAFTPYAYHDWDCHCREWMRDQFRSERNHYGLYYLYQIAHLNKCLALF